MFFVQTIVPAVFVFLAFTIGHLFVGSQGSGIYLPESNFDQTENVVPDEITEEVDPLTIDPATGQLLPDKYNYLKIENVFSGKIIGSEKLFSIELALLTKQSAILSDLFISALFEMEADLVAEITNVILEVEVSQLTTLEGRAVLTEKVRSHVNDYLETEGMTPGISEVFIINYNLI